MASKAAQIPPVTSFNENTLTGERIREQLPISLKIVLSLYDWVAASDMVTLSPDTVTPPFMWAYRYTLPGNYLKKIAVYNTDDEIMGDKGYKILGGKLLTNENVIKLIYVTTCNVDQVHKLPDYLGAAVAHHMAYNLIGSIHGSSEKFKVAYQLYQVSLKEAKRCSDEENPFRQIEWESDWLSSRGDSNNRI